MSLEERILEAVGGVPDPEIPVISLVELGIVRGVRGGEAPEILLTPTYSGCPAGLVIQQNVRQALDEAGLGAVAIRTEIFPPWTTDWITEAGRAKLRAYGIAPPETAAGRLGGRDAMPAICPRCGSADTAEISRFGSTPCKALWRCLACAEPFDRFKCI